MSVQLNLVDGSVLPCCPKCGEIVPEMEAQKTYIEGLEKELRVKRAQVSRLIAEQAGADKSNPHYEAALQVYAYWKEKLAPGSRTFGAAHRKVVLARLKEGWTVDELKRAIDGYFCRPYVTVSGRSHTGRPSERRIDLELICRDEKHINQGIAFWEEDRGKDIELLQRGYPDGATELCDCGHPRVYHAMTSVMAKVFADLGQEPPLGALNEPCGVRGCDCMAFDTIQRRADEFIEREKRRAKRAA